MKSKTTQISRDAFCTIRPDYPEIGFSLVLLLEGREARGIYPLIQLFSTTKEASDVTRALIRRDVFNIQKKKIRIQDYAILFELKKQKLFTLKKEYWIKPDLSYSDFDRRMMFRKMIGYPLWYKLLVTPTNYNKKTKKWEFSAMLPYLITEDEPTFLNNFIRRSDAPVNTRAIEAAIYTPTHLKKINWITDTIGAFDQLTLRAITNYLA